MTLTQFEEVTRYLFKTLGPANRIDSGLWGWYYNQFSIYVSMADKTDFFSPSISLFYNSPSNDQGRPLFQEESWVESDWFIGRDLKEFMNNYRPKPITYKKESITVELEYPENIDLHNLSTAEQVRRYGVK